MLFPIILHQVVFEREDSESIRVFEPHGLFLTLVTDYFALLNEPRRPWLDADALKEKFHRLTASHHPDVTRDAGFDFSTLNAAYNTLRDPKSRVRHLLELEFPAELSRPLQIPPALGDSFMAIGALLQRLDAFLKKQSEAASPLTAALLAPEKFSLIENVEEQLAVVNERHAKLLDELRALDARWDTEKPGARLAEIYQALLFVAKWSDQLREGTMKLHA